MDTPQNSLEPLWVGLVNIYQEFRTICDRHHLRHSLAWGSVLGAIRHKGFIPWDDDLDVMMPREDYDKFIEIVEKELPSQYRLVTHSNTPEFIGIFSKIMLVDRDAVQDIEKKLGFECREGIFIDIFPLDGLHPNWLIRQSRLIRLACLQFIFSYRRRLAFEKLRVKSVLGGFVGGVLCLFSWKNSLRDVVNKIEDISRRTPFGGSRYFGHFAEYFCFQAPRHLTKEYTGSVVVPFMNGDATILNSYEQYLRVQYGDYLKLPPESARVPRHTEGADAIWKFGPTGARKTTVFYISSDSFPNGAMASGNRMMHIGKALQQGDIKVVVLSSGSDSGRTGYFVKDGMEFYSLCDWYDSKIRRCLSRYILFPIRALKLIRAKKTDEIVLYAYTADLVFTIYAWILAKILRCPICREASEYPHVILLPGSRLKKWFGSKVLMKLFDGFIAISPNLVEYYKNIGKRDCSVIQVPMTVDWDMFAAEKRPSPFPFEYIAYTGAMQREGGGVDVLIRAFVLIAEKHPQLHLVLIGAGNAELQRKFEALAGDCAGRIHCIFGGKLPREEMPRYIANAKILATLPLPTLQQQGCFPTKLGEYLSSAVPTVITRVGNPVQYLTDNENVFYVPPSDERATAAKFEAILAEYDKAQIVGKAGQKFAYEHFHYANFVEPLAAWYRQIIVKGK